MPVASFARTLGVAPLPRLEALLGSSAFRSCGTLCGYLLRHWPWRPVYARTSFSLPKPAGFSPLPRPRPPPHLRWVPVRVPPAWSCSGYARASLYFSRDLIEASARRTRESAITVSLFSAFHSGLCVLPPVVEACTERDDWRVVHRWSVSSLLSFLPLSKIIANKTNVVKKL